MSAEMSLPAFDPNNQPPNDLNEARRSITALDTMLARGEAERLRWCRRVGEVKAQASDGLQPLQPDHARESEVLATYMAVLGDTRAARLMAAAAVLNGREAQGILDTVLGPEFGVQIVSDNDPKMAASPNVPSGRYDLWPG